MVKILSLTVVGLLTVLSGVLAVQTELPAVWKNAICAGIVLLGVMVRYWGCSQETQLSGRLTKDASGAALLSFTMRYWGPLLMFVGVALFLLAPAAPRTAPVAKAKPVAKASPQPVAPTLISRYENKPATYRLGGIFAGIDSPGAIINGKLYRIGDQVGSAQVVAISSSHVALQIENQTRFLTLKSPATTWNR